MKLLKKIDNHKKQFLKAWNEFSKNQKKHYKRCILGFLIFLIFSSILMGKDPYNSSINFIITIIAGIGGGFGFSGAIFFIYYTINLDK